MQRTWGKKDSRAIGKIAPSCFNPATITSISEGNLVFSGFIVLLRRLSSRASTSAAVTQQDFVIRDIRRNDGQHLSSRASKQ